MTICQFCHFRPVLTLYRPVLTLFLILSPDVNLPYLCEIRQICVKYVKYVRFQLIYEKYMKSAPGDEDFYLGNTKYAQICVKLVSIRAILGLN